LSVRGACALCGSGHARPVLVDAGQPVVRCATCGFIYCDPIPDPGELADYYDASYRDWERWEATFRHDRSLVFQHGLTRIRQFQPTGRLLDVGCSLGFFLEAARQVGYAVAGVDVSVSAARFARERLGLEVHPVTLREARLPGGAFDVVTLWDVLEHVPDPMGELMAIHRLLRGGGLLVVRLPNVDFHLPKTRLVRALCPGRVIGLDARNHLNHFSPRTLRFALARAGFSLRALEAGVPNLYGNPLVDGLKRVYWTTANAVHRWPGVMIGNILEAYAIRRP